MNFKRMRNILLAVLLIIVAAIAIYRASRSTETKASRVNDSMEYLTYEELYSLQFTTNFAKWVIHRKAPKIGQLRDLLADEDKDVRYISAILLLRRGQFDMVPVVLQVAADVDTPYLREDALGTLNRVSPEQLSAAGVPAFVGKLMQREDVIRNDALFMSCLRLLAYVGTESSIRELENLLNQEEIPDSLKADIVINLISTDNASPRIIEKARGYLVNPDINRVYLARHLARAGDLEATRALEMWLDDPEISQEQKIKEISPTLIYLRSEAAEAYLLGVLEEEKDYQLLYTAASLLDRYGNDAGFTKLLEGFKSPDAKVRGYVVEQMGHSGDERFIQILTRTKLHDPDASLRMRALIALSDIEGFK